MTPDVQPLFGPLLIGVFLNTILYGMLLVQAFIYYRTYRNDPAWTRYFILYLVILETLNTVFDIGVIYEPLVFRYGTPRAMEHVPVLLYVDPLVTVMISTSVQLFIIWRIRIISQSNLLPSIILFFALSSLIGGIAATVADTHFVLFSQLPKFKGAIITWLASSAITDLSITASLVWSLKQRKTGYSKTDDIINRVIKLTIHTGALTALFATLDLIAFLAIQHKTVNFVFDLALGKLYTNSLLSTLNARAGWSSFTARTQHSDNVLFGPAPPLPDGLHHSNLQMRDIYGKTDTVNTSTTLHFDMPHGEMSTNMTRLNEMDTTRINITRTTDELNTIAV